MAEIRWVQDELPKFLRYASRIRIATKEQGIVRLDRLLSSQRFLAVQIFAGLDRGLHDFLILKARQLGVSTLLWALDLWWLQRWNGIQAIYAADDGANTELHRQTMMTMYESVPRKFNRGKPKTNNRLLLEWEDLPARQGKHGLLPPWTASKVVWAHGNASESGQLGRSLGLNYAHLEELDSWTDREGMKSMSAALAREHPHRLYLRVGTGQGYNLLYELWEGAGDALTKRRIFIGWWHLDTRRVERDAGPLWDAYGRMPPSPEERGWITEVQRQFGEAVSQEQLAWWRMTMAESENVRGDLATMLSEYPWFPEQSFQAAGTQFVSGPTVLRLHGDLRRSPLPRGYRYEWGPTFDAKGDDALVEVEPIATDDGRLLLEGATLTVWEDPNPAGVYVVAGDPAYGSSENADSFAATVWRCWPDRLVQVAQYKSPVGAMYQFTWILAHLAGVYPRYLIYEVTGPGYAVLQEFKRLRDAGFGLSQKRGQLQHVIGSIQEYLYLRPDHFTNQPALEWKSNAERREWAFTQFADLLDRGGMEIRSRELYNEIGALRRNGVRIEPGGVAHDDLVVTAALASTYFLDTILYDIQDELPASNAIPTAQQDPTQRTVRSFLRQMGRHPSKDDRRTYGVRVAAPGR